ncbi:unnamed protein product [Caenorhabditis sp. 36 PRJEB53466]|nr:unnamed protein product [Caenorhabditis sp. 36 PRJEB53466]
MFGHHGLKEKEAAQNPDKSDDKLIPIENHHEIAQFFDDPGFEPKHLALWGENHVFVSRKPMKDAIKTSSYTNIAYGSLTTSAARIRLYKAMKAIGPENLIYCDTDSVIFKQKRGRNVLGDLIGSGLGMLTNETPAVRVNHILPAYG